MNDSLGSASSSTQTAAITPADVTTIGVVPEAARAARSFSAADTAPEHGPGLVRPDRLAGPDPPEDRRFEDVLELVARHPWAVLARGTVDADGGVGVALEDVVHLVLVPPGVPRDLDAESVGNRGGSLALAHETSADDGVDGQVAAGELVRERGRLDRAVVGQHVVVGGAERRLAVSREQDRRHRASICAAESKRHPRWGAESGTTGLEPATSAVTGQRSNQLSYAPG